MATIAILEDEAVTAIALEQTLLALGHRVVGAAKNVEAFLEIVNANPIDLAMIDIMVDGQRDGISAAAALRSGINPAIIFLTSHSDEQTVSRAKAVRPNGYILKPFEETGVFVGVETALANHDGRITADDSALSNLSGPVNGGLTPFQLRKVDIYVKDQIASDITVASLAIICGLSEAHFATQFKKSTSRTPNQYVTDVRVASAQTLLRNTPHSIADIAVRVGYSNLSYFSSLFRKQTGLSPSEYRDV